MRARMQEEHLDARVVAEAADALRLVERRVPDAVVGERGPDHVEEILVLREDDGLGAGIVLSQPEDMAEQVGDLGGVDGSVEIDVLDLCQLLRVELGVDPGLLAWGDMLQVLGAGIRVLAVHFQLLRLERDVV